MFISKIYLDGNKKKTALAIQNRELFHAAIESSVDGERPHILWRLNPSDMTLLMLSEKEQDLTGICRQFGSGKRAPRAVPYGPYIDSFSEGDRVQFIAEVNPVINVKCPGSTKNGKDIPLNIRRTKNRPFSAEDWMVRKLEESGASHIHLRYESHTTVGVIKKGKRFPLFTVTYSGEFVIRDAEAVKRAMMRGIGGKKTYGCGMLSLVKLPKENLK